MKMTHTRLLLLVACGLPAGCPQAPAVVEPLEAGSASAVRSTAVSEDCPRWIDLDGGERICIDELIGNLAAQQLIDLDGDGVPNLNDPDVDGDGIPNGDDFDVDGDGISNQDDPDIDGDGVPNVRDVDIDGDFVRNEFDLDIDGDGFLNPLDPDADGDRRAKKAKPNDPENEEDKKKEDDLQCAEGVEDCNLGSLSDAADTQPESADEDRGPTDEQVEQLNEDGRNTAEPSAEIGTRPTDEEREAIVAQIAIVLREPPATVRETARVYEQAAISERATATTLIRQVERSVAEVGVPPEEAREAVRAIHGQRVVATRLLVATGTFALGESATAAETLESGAREVGAKLAELVDAARIGTELDEDLPLLQSAEVVVELAEDARDAGIREQVAAWLRELDEARDAFDDRPALERVFAIVTDTLEVLREDENTEPPSVVQLTRVIERLAEGLDDGSVSSVEQSLAVLLNATADADVELIAVLDRLENELSDGLTIADVEQAVQELEEEEEAAENEQQDT